MRTTTVLFERSVYYMERETIKLFDSELKVMDILWKEGNVPAKHVADVLTKELGWNKILPIRLLSVV